MVCRIHEGGEGRAQGQGGEGREVAGLEDETGGAATTMEIMTP
jgi:hypothetical protein